MSITDVFQALADRQMSIKITPGGALQVTNASRLDDDLRTALKAHKAQIIRELSLPVLDYVLLVFEGCVVLDRKGKRRKRQPSQTRSLDMEP